VADLPLTAWSGLAASLGTFNLPLADMRQDGAEVFVLDNACLRNLPQLVEGGVRQVEPTIADRQPAVGIEYSVKKIEAPISIVVLPLGALPKYELEKPAHRN
jgi:hypothetical protein